MASIIFKIRGAAMSALAFNSTIFFFSKLLHRGEKENTLIYLALEKLQGARDNVMNRMKRADFINKILRKKRSKTMH